MLPAPLVKVKQRRAFRLRVRLFKKRPYYVVLGLDFPLLALSVARYFSKSAWVFLLTLMVALSSRLIAKSSLKIKRADV